MAKTRADRQTAALRGGMAAVSTQKGRGEPKIGVAEFLALARRFGISAPGVRRIKAALQKEDWGQGPFLANYYSGLKETCVQAFEKAACRLFGVRHAIATSSGTGALQGAFVAAGVGPGSEVIVPAIGFIATAQAVVAARGVPVFCDVDASLAMDPAKIEQCITPRTVALAPTHVMGSVCDMGAIMRIARRRKLMVVEDCAQACGARFNGQYVGAIGQLGCFSISAYKIVGGGEGGLLLTNQGRLWERASQVVESGGLWRPERFAQQRYAGELFCGTNYRLSELEAAVDVVQLAKVESTVKRFRAVKQRVLGRLKSYRQILPQKLNDPDGEVGYTLRFFPESVALAEKIADALQAAGIKAATRGHKGLPDWHLSSYMYPVLLKQSSTSEGCPWNCPLYKQRGGKIQYTSGDCPVAEDLFARMVNIDLNQWFTARACRDLADEINQVLSSFCTADPSAAPWV